MASVNRDLAARLAAQCGLAASDVPALLRSITDQGPDFQAAVLQHGSDVAAYLTSQGVEQAALARLLQRCTRLFATPVAQVAVPFEALLTVGLTPTEAAGSLPRHPTGSWWATYRVRSRAELAARVAHLRQHLGFTPKTLAQPDAKYLLRQPTTLLVALEAALEQELGIGRRLFTKYLRRFPPEYRGRATWQYIDPTLEENVERLRRRVEPLVQARFAPGAHRVAARLLCLAASRRPCLPGSLPHLLTPAARCFLRAPGLWAAGSTVRPGGEQRAVAGPGSASRLGVR